MVWPGTKCAIFRARQLHDEVHRQGNQLLRWDRQGLEKTEWFQVQALEAQRWKDLIYFLTEVYRPSHQKILDTKFQVLKWQK